MINQLKDFLDNKKLFIFDFDGTLYNAHLPLYKEELETVILGGDVNE